LKDIQSYIVKNSSFTDNDRLRKLYKELGLFVPLHDENSQGSDNKKSGMLLVEKTSRVMA
jgi:hypothetical protein